MCPFSSSQLPSKTVEVACALEVGSLPQPWPDWCLLISCWEQRGVVIINIVNLGLISLDLLLYNVGNNNNSVFDIWYCGAYSKHA